MVKKLQKMAAKKKAAAETGFPAGLLDSPVAQSVKDSAQQIWAAGLASFNKAQGEGSKVFEALVSEGLKLQKKTQSAAEDKLGSMASKFTGMASEVGSRAGQHWDKLEAIFEQRVAKALKTLGVPTAGDIEALVKRLDELSGTATTKPATRSAKSSEKPPTKPSAKSAGKTTAKSAPAAKKASRPAPKAAGSPAPKAAVKAAAKTSTKAPAKNAAKTPARRSARKPAAAA